MMGTMKEILSRKGGADCVKAEDFNDPSFHDAHADYLLGEIRDQLLFYYSQEEFELFLQFFSHLNGKRKFSYKEFLTSMNSFVADCSSSGKRLPQFFESAEIFLQFLYEQNVICYIENDAGMRDAERFIRWCFRERTLSNLSPKVRTHVNYAIFPGLTKALNVGRPIRVVKAGVDRDVGTIIRLSGLQGYGFIRGGAKQSEYYFKFDQLRFDAARLRIGDKVTYEVRVKYGKVRAESIERG